MIACFEVMYINHANCTRPEVHACPGCMGTRIQSGYVDVVPRYHTCTLECERIDCNPYMARSREKIGRIWLTSGQAIYAYGTVGEPLTKGLTYTGRFSQFLARQTIPVGGSY